MESVRSSSSSKWFRCYDLLSGPLQRGTDRIHQRHYYIRWQSVMSSIKVKGIWDLSNWIVMYLDMILGMIRRLSLKWTLITLLMDRFVYTQCSAVAESIVHGLLLGFTLLWPLCAMMVEMCFSCQSSWGYIRAAVVITFRICTDELVHISCTYHSYPILLGLIGWCVFDMRSPELFVRGQLEAEDSKKRRWCLWWPPCFGRIKIPCIWIE